MPPVPVGVPHGTVAQLDKHSDEHALQRISTPVIEACTEIDKIVRTDIPELKRPWFSENHNDVVYPLFLTVFKLGVVFYTDESKNWIVFYRQLFLKLFILSGGSFEDDENIPLAPETIDCKLSRCCWSSING